MTVPVKFNKKGKPLPKKSKVTLRGVGKGIKGTKPRTDKDTKLPANSVDAVFICDTYHHFEFPQATLATIHRALKPGGVMVLIDFHRIPGQSSDWTLNHVRAGQEVFVKEIEEAGFERLADVKVDFLKENYLVKFRKR